jgi:hypothetical protein
MPKRLVTLRGGCFYAYEAEFDRTTNAEADWFR